MAKEKKQQSVQDWPSYWFVQMEEAVNNSDFSAAAEAQRELERLGVSVKFHRKPSTRPAEDREVAHA